MTDTDPLAEMRHTCGAWKHWSGRYLSYYCVPCDVWLDTRARSTENRPPTPSQGQLPGTATNPGRQP